MQETYTVGDEEAKSFFIKGKELQFCVCAHMCVSLCACFFRGGDRDRDSSFLHTVGKVYAPWEVLFIFLPVPFVKYGDPWIAPCHSVG